LLAVVSDTALSALSAAGCLAVVSDTGVVCFIGGAVWCQAPALFGWCLTLLLYRRIGGAVWCQAPASALLAVVSDTGFVRLCVGWCLTPLLYRRIGGLFGVRHQLRLAGV
jgi:hypothetical protein